MKHADKIKNFSIRLKKTHLDNTHDAKIHGTIAVGKNATHTNMRYVMSKWCSFAVVSCTDVRANLKMIPNKIFNFRTNLFLLLYQMKKNNILEKIILLCHLMKIIKNKRKMYNATLILLNRIKAWNMRGNFMKKKMCPILFTSFALSLFKSRYNDKNSEIQHWLHKRGENRR